MYANVRADCPGWCANCGVPLNYTTLPVPSRCPAPSTPSSPLPHRCEGCWPDATDVAAARRSSPPPPPPPATTTTTTPTPPTPPPPTPPPPPFQLPVSLLPGASSEPPSWSPAHGLASRLQVSANSMHHVPLTVGFLLLIATGAFALLARLWQGDGSRCHRRLFSERLVTPPESAEFGDADADGPRSRGALRDHEDGSASGGGGPVHAPVRLSSSRSQRDRRGRRRERGHEQADGDAADGDVEL